MRVFLAIDIPKDIKNKIYELQKDFKIKGIKLVEKENLHITVKFLGEVDDNTLNKILNLNLEIPKTKIELKGLGTFPNENYIRVIWIGVYGEGLINIFKEIDNKLNTLGFEKERSYVPHLTLGRVKFIENKKLLKEKINKNKDIFIGEFETNSIKLYKSTLTPTGPIYEVIKEWKS
ncbi:RNA 2',3'-cyclic phosphodiesterase [Methanocaldococcus indicus]|uniref:RNA 2',3'-cyclic phosphodiesterase n=1 Tax=Methanocaldococcus indicus TaxID=213231 RepID=UPI003C6D5115